jgi:hypothetical protein
MGRPIWVVASVMAAVSERNWPFPLLEDAQDVLDDDDGRIDDDAEIDGAERNQVGRDARSISSMKAPSSKPAPPAPPPAPSGSCPGPRKEDEDQQHQRDALDHVVPTVCSVRSVSAVRS